MVFFDTHCHIHELEEALTPVHEKWQSDGLSRTGQTVLEAARAAGVRQIITVGTTPEDSALAVRFAQRHDDVWAVVGIHPHEAKNYTTPQKLVSGGQSSQPQQQSSQPFSQQGGKRISPEVVRQFSALVADQNVVAIGECGLDYHYNHSSPEDQEVVLRYQLEFALAHGLPLSFHVREAFDDFWRILDDYQGVRGVLHSFTDTQVAMEQAVSRGLYIGVNGIATFTRDESQLVTYRTIPQHSLLLETDAPFLTPKPFRGTICESKHVVATAEFLSELRRESLSELAQKTTENAERLFGHKVQLW